MDFVPDIGDTSTIPSFPVGGVGRVEIIDHCMVRVTFYEPVAEDGRHVPAVQLLWTVPAWRAARPILEQVAQELAAHRHAPPKTGERHH